MKSNSTPRDLAKLVHKRLDGVRFSSSTPSQSLLDVLFENLFYTSLKTEEGQFIKVTVTLIDPNNPDPNPPGRIVADRWNFIHFKERLPFTVKNLTKLSKAADPWSSSLAVYYEKNDLYIWGMIDQAIHYQSFLNYEAESGPEQPGLFQTTITGIGCINVIFDYELISSLKHNSMNSYYIDVFNFGPVYEMLKSNSLNLKQAIKNYLEEEFEGEKFDEWDNFIQSIINQSISRILLRIQNYQHGGALLICNGVRENLDIKYQIDYTRFHDSLKSLLKLTIENSIYSNELIDFIESSDEIPVDTYLADTVSENSKNETQDELKGAIRFISSLSCVDGLVALSSDFKVKGFGGVIKINNIPEFIYISKSARINEKKLQKIDTNHFGTRHRSMFSYCWDNDGSLGFVVSQDGDIRAITKVNNKLIMWENIKVQQFIRSKKLSKKKILKK